MPAFAMGKELNLVVPGANGASSSSCSGADGDHIDIAVPPDAFSAIEHIPDTGQAARYWLIALMDPARKPFLDAHVGLSAELPNFTTPDGRPLLTQYDETNLDFLLRTARTFTPGETLTVSQGEIGGWPSATLREIPASFTLDELLVADPSRFPVYTGPAVVADIATGAVLPEPASYLLALIGVLGTGRRRRRLSALASSTASNSDFSNA